MTVTVISPRARISGQGAFQMMGWSYGHPLNYSITDQVITLHDAVNHRHRLRIGHRGQLHLPTAARHATGIRSGDQLLLIAVPDHGIVAIFPPALSYATLSSALPEFKDRP